MALCSQQNLCFAILLTPLILRIAYLCGIPFHNFGATQTPHTEDNDNNHIDFLSSNCTDDKEREIFSIEIDKGSAIANDIVCIQHHRKESKIVVRLHRERRCEEPYLKGRLSGPVLTMVEWETTNWQTNEELQEIYLVGKYDIPPQYSSEAKYFIEIIVVMCTPIRYDTDFESICIEDPLHHRLTVRNASIETMTMTTAHHGTKKHPKRNQIGYWHHNNRTTPKPLFTRFQTQECYDKFRIGRIYNDNFLSAALEAEEQGVGSGLHTQELQTFIRDCKDHEDLSRFDPYRFEFEKGLDLEGRLVGKHEVICFSGASHSKRLAQKTTKLIQSVLGNQSTIEIDQPGGYHRFAASYDPSVVQSFIDRNCTKVVVGTGQWDLIDWYTKRHCIRTNENSHFSQKRGPTPFITYEYYLSDAMGSMKEKFLEANIDLYFRSTHYNPIKAHTSHCPPIEWRNPPVIDMYNKITKKLCQKYGIPLIETNDIVGVTWDRAKDYNHYDDISGETEAAYILNQIFA